MFIFHPEAEFEFLTQIAYYAKQKSNLGNIFLQRVNDAVERIQLQPDRYKTILAPNIKQLGVIQFPFHIIYRLQNTQIQVLAVAAQKREPLYWQHRRFN